MSHPMARGAAALPLLASWSAHGLHRQATRVEVRRRRDYAARGVFACGASRRPLLRLCLPPTSRAVGPQWPRVAVARGRQLRSWDEAWGDWWLSASSFAPLSGYRPLSLTCYVSVRAARLSCSTPLSRRGVRARHRDLNRCSMRSRLDAASRPLHLLAYARLSQAVRLPPGRYQRRAAR